MTAVLYHLQLNVADAARSIPFYKACLGWLGFDRVLDEGPAHLGIGNGHTDLWVIQTQGRHRAQPFHRKRGGLNHGRSACRRARTSTGRQPAGEIAGLVGAAPGALSRYQVAADPRFRDAAPGALEACAALGAEVLVALRFQDDLRGLLVLGPKRSEAAWPTASSSSTPSSSSGAC